MYCSCSQYSQYLGHQSCPYSKYSEYLGRQCLVYEVAWYWSPDIYGSYTGFHIAWQGIIVPEWCSSAVVVLDLSGSVVSTVQLGHVTIMIRGESVWQRIDSFVCGACDNKLRPRVWYTHLCVRARVNEVRAHLCTCICIITLSCSTAPRRST